jgi:neutral ceramidase
MAGRRLRNAVKTMLSGDKSFGSNFHVVLAGMTDTYSQYEEYEVWRFGVMNSFIIE